MSIDDETKFCSPPILENVLKCKVSNVNQGFHNSVRTYFPKLLY